MESFPIVAFETAGMEEGETLPFQQSIVFGEACAMVAVVPYDMPEFGVDAEQTIEHQSLLHARLAVMKDIPYIQRVKVETLNYKVLSEGLIVRNIRAAMCRHGLILTPKKFTVIASETYEVKSGAKWNRTRVEAVYRLTHVKTGEHENMVALGEGADPGDKSTPKALTNAFKYALRQAFMIETGDDPDLVASEESARLREGDKPTNGQAKQEPAKPTKEEAEKAAAQEKAAKFGNAVRAVWRAADAKRLDDLKEAYVRRGFDKQEIAILEHMREIALARLSSSPSAGADGAPAVRDVVL